MTFLLFLEQYLVCGRVIHRTQIGRSLVEREEDASDVPIGRARQPIARARVIFVKPTKPTVCHSNKKPSLNHYIIVSSPACPTAPKKVDVEREYASPHADRFLQATERTRCCFSAKTTSAVRRHSSRKRTNRSILGSSMVRFATPRTTRSDSLSRSGLILPNGAINWDCPCLGGMASGPCSLFFRRAFTCFHNSDSANKGAECLSDFAALTECLAKYPKLYGNHDKSSSNTDATASSTTAIANAFSSQT